MRQSPWAVKALIELPERAKEVLCDVLGIAVRSLWGRPQWNTGDLEGEDVRAAAIGQLSVIYVVNQLTLHLSILDIIWIG
ncbi:hypothetical protein [Streptomyces albogriseolus]|uniref:hypothetical protein n=1 Tax=Streptomyces albogriseolus TaxID=1887 RepID=UPI0034604807